MPVVGWAVTIPALLTLAAVGSGLACALIVLVEALGWGGCWPCLTSAYPINALLTMTAGVGMTLYESQRLRLEGVRLELRARELDHERARKMALEARLASLESRLQPHFLFNTLNAISALIQEDPDHAERMVERLAALLRFSLDATGRGVVPLADELKIVTDYLEIERTRLGERLAFTHRRPRRARAGRGAAAVDPDAGREQREARRGAAAERRPHPRDRDRHRWRRSRWPCGTTAPASPTPRCGPATAWRACRRGCRRATATRRR